MTKEERQIYNKAYNAANKEKKRIYNKAYNEANKEKIKAHRGANKEKKRIYNKVYNEANEEKIRAYYEADKEKRLAYQKAYGEANKEKLRAYYAANKEKFITKSTRRRARRVSCESDGHTLAELRAYWTANDLNPKICIYCNDKIVGWKFSVGDHVFPFAKGGKDVLENLVPCCRHCNSSKGSKLLYDEWMPSNTREKAA
jgi:5-methylcytosine-specific restriction endonuclease McrA